MSDHHKHVSHNGDSTGLGDKKLSTTESIHVDGEVTIDFPVDVKNETANAKRESDRKERRKFRLDVATFIVVSIYAALTAYQAREMRQTAIAANEANHLLEESTRGRVELDFSLDSPPQPGKDISADITVKNIGHTSVYYTVQSGGGDLVTMPKGPMPIVPGQYVVAGRSLDEQGSGHWKDDWKLVPKENMPATQWYLDQLPSLKDALNHDHVPTSVSRYFFGRVTYESIGKKHQIDFCRYVVKDEGGQFLLFECPKWNSAEPSQ